tara:strand:- start:2188 stop:3108 length:921 start_codon:yes stop_codon:yes gene_type:complete
MDEFALINRFFSRRIARTDVIAGIGDDGAVLSPGAGLEQVQVIDTLVEGVHFPPDTRAQDIAWRAVAVNLSDIAAMGARPRWMTLALTLTNSSEAWLESFAAGLFAAADEHDVALVGGDTTYGATLVVTISISAELHPGTALLRSGAKPGDTVFVSGTLGDAAAGLSLLQQQAGDDWLTTRFLRPTARIDTGLALVGKATAAIDVSDGLAGDLRKLLDASGVGARIDIEKIPLSEALCNRFDTARRHQYALSGGDDYELCFTAPAAAVAGVPGITAIGIVTDTGRLEFFLHGDVVEVDNSGYRHFS